MPDIAETDAFARLQADWGSGYEITRDDDPASPEPYKAVRRDGTGMLTAKDPEALRDAVLRDYLAREEPGKAAS